MNVLLMFVFSSKTGLLYQVKKKTCHVNHRQPRFYGSFLDFEYYRRMYENKQNMLSYTNIIISTTQNLELNKQLPNGSRSEQNIVKHTT